MCRESFQNAFCRYKFFAQIKKTLPLWVTARKVMICFWKSAPFGAASRDFRRSWSRKVVISKKLTKRSLPFSLSPVMPLNINWNRFQGWCAAKFVQLISCAGRQKSLGNTVLSTCRRVVISSANEVKESKQAATLSITVRQLIATPNIFSTKVLRPEYPQGKNTITVLQLLESENFLTFKRT